MPTGICKLCLRDKELKDSHYLPKRLYSYCRDSELKNPNPVVIARGELKQVSDQLRRYVFCADCEKKLNENGEKWVLASIPHEYGGDFPLHRRLEPVNPIGIAEGLNVYDLSGIAGFDLASLIYFGASIFWRGSAYDWKSSLEVPAPPVKLGGHEEGLRKFVLGTDELPKDIVITLDIWPYTKVLQTAYPPHENNLPECFRYWFYIPGLLYAFHFGERTPEPLRNRDLRKGIVGVDRSAADSVYDFTKARLMEAYKGPRIEAMLKEIAAVRSRQTPNGR